VLKNGFKYYTILLFLTNLVLPEVAGVVEIEDSVEVSLVVSGLIVVTKNSFT